jgi:N,N-dimethylformamidase
MEVRKESPLLPEHLAYTLARLGPGEQQHSTTLEVGGLWMRRGAAPRTILGVEHSANIFERREGSRGFRRLPASYEAPYAFVFDRVPEGTIGDFGLNLGSAAGFEMDAVQAWAWQQNAAAVALARAEHEAFIPSLHHPTAAVSDIALWSLPAGAAVFAAGSVTWTGSLSHHGYDNNVSRITENVLRRFLETPLGEAVLDEAQDS